MQLKCISIQILACLQVVNDIDLIASELDFGFWYITSQNMHIL